MSRYRSDEDVKKILKVILTNSPDWIESLFEPVFCFFLSNWETQFNNLILLDVIYVLFNSQNCINALGKSWHPDHFVCTHCNRSFGSDGFLVDSGRPYCEKCFSDLFSVKCGKCMNPITGGEKYVEALSKNWHSTCFTCNQCNSKLEGNSFFVSGGMPYCQNHKAGK